LIENPQLIAENVNVVRLMALTACGWLALTVFAPLLPVPLAGVAYLLGSLVCHQLPDRSFHIGASQLPVCARCLGIYAGVAVSMVFWVLSSRVPGSTVPGSRALLIAGAIPTAATVALEWLGMWEPSNVARVFAGLPLGAVVAFVVTGAVAKLHYLPCAPQRPIAPRRPPTPI
jgi:uncharacterized membrane protein